MSANLIAMIGLVYAYISVELLWKGNYGLSIAFLGYAIGNVGLYLEALKT
jgi:hypothetical protein